MARDAFYKLLQSEIDRIDTAGTTKRNERLIEGFTNEATPQAIIGGKSYHVFNSNDYLGLRHHRALKEAEKEAGEKFGTGPGAVRFISGAMQVHRDLEKALAAFHGRDDAMVISSAFAANLSVLFALTKGQSSESKVQDRPIVISDAINHRSIIDGIRLNNLDKDQKVIYQHLDAGDLRRVLQEAIGKFDRAVVVTDGVFSMLGEIAPLQALRQVVDEFDAQFTNGVLFVVDDCHGIGAIGQSGRGAEEIENTKADVLVGTLGKGLGADGGYIVANQTVIDYLRESAAPYIYSNSFSPGTAAAGLAAVKLLSSGEGKQFTTTLAENVKHFKEIAIAKGLQFAAQSDHPIQPVLIGDAQKAKAVTEALFAAGYLVTNLSFPVVQKGRDEIRVQISAAHSKEVIDAFVEAFAQALAQTA